ncbi:hypothetical protein ACFSUS_14415 [Spirosoma soli]|uniref:DUF5723 domain-containing protein n=2 Tax=Spirosoma soli TaxID=1770529 RepID=A0ABW5M5A6_9BACT
MTSKAQSSPSGAYYIEDYIDTTLRATNEEVRFADSTNVANRANTSFKKLRLPLFSEPTLNRMFAKRVAYYLSGSNDIALYRNFAIVDTKGFTISNSFAFPADPAKMTRFLINTGVRIPLSNNQAVLYQSDRLQRGITGLFNVVFFKKGSVFFPSDNDARFMSAARTFLDSAIRRKVARERSDFRAVYEPKPNTPINNTLFDERKADFEKSLVNKYAAEIADEEEVYGLKRINSVRKQWFVINGEVPYSAIDNKLIEQDRRQVRNISYRPFIIGAQYAYFINWQKTGMLFTMDAKLRNDDVIRFYNDYKTNIANDSISSFGRSLGIQKITGDTTFLDHRYRNIGTFTFSPSVYLSLSEAKFAIARDAILFNGMAFNLSTQTVINKLFSYNNVNLGVIFSLAGKDGKPINLELLGTFVDVFNQLAPPESKASRFTVTASLAIPLSSVIF